MEVDGNFEYGDRGLLDSGHIRLFNEKSAKKLLEMQDLRLLSLN